MEENTMMHVKFASLLALLIAVLGTICAPQTASAACTATTIGNSYGFRFDGFVGPSTRVPLKVPAFLPEAVAGEISFTATSDSAGTLNGSESGNIGGVVFQLTFTGTYTVNAPKCTGSLTRTLSNGFTGSDDFVIVDSGREIEFVSTSPGIVEQGGMKIGVN
jgi:hypothetical protein